MNALRLLVASALLGAVFVGLATASRAGEPSIVGILALVDDPEVAKELGLSDTQKEKLVELMESRESAAYNLWQEVRDLTPGERLDKLAPFRRASEEKGLPLLTAEQQAKLKQIRIRLLGLASLADEGVAAKLDLTAEQKAAAATLLREREDRLSVTSKDRKHIVRADFERKLAALLTEKQAAAWDGLIADAGGQTPAGTPASASPTTASPTSSEPASATPAAATPGSTAESKVASTPASETPASVRPAPFPDDTAGKTVPGPSAAKPEVAQTPSEAKPAAPAAEKAEKKVRFSFRYQPWSDVLEWFAKQADLSLIAEFPPKGTFNYTDDKEYTPAEAIDLLNSVLQTKGYVLLRRNRMLMLVNLEDGPIPPNLIDTISLEQLDKRGDYELVAVLFQLQKLTPEEIEPEIKKMIGPQGSVLALSKSKQLLVTETASRLKAIRRTIERSDDPDGVRAQSQVRQFDLQYADPVQTLVILRQFLDIAPEQSTSQDGSIKIILDPSGKNYLVSGKEEKVARFSEILKMLDIEGNKPKTPGIDQTPQLEVYSVGTMDPQTVLQVMQTLLAGSPDARLALDAKSNSLVALCKPADHATIKATLDQMGKDARKIEVIQLTRIDPQTAASAISKLFGTGEKEDPTKPQVETDVVTKQIIVRATPSQLEQIKTLLEKMGESGTGESVAGDRGNVRMLPLTGRAARSALERAEEIWPTMHKNRIRVVTPSAAIPTMRPSGAEGSPAREGMPNIPGIPPDFIEKILGPGPTRERPAEGEPELPAPGERPGTRIIRPKAPATSPAPGPKPESPASPGFKQTGNPPAPRPAATGRTASVASPHNKVGPRVVLVSQLAPAKEGAAAAEATPEASKAGETAPGAKVGSPGEAGSSAKPAPAKSQPKTWPNGEPPPIIVAPGPGGIMIASEDTEALDAFEDLLNQLGGMESGEMDLTVFYLKHAKAEVAADLLEQVFGASSSSGGGGGGGRGGFLGEMAGAALGDAGGGILGSLLGLGGPGGSAIAASGTIQITPDPRLNALVVQANAKDLDMVEHLLKIIDQDKSPEEVAVEPKPRVIAVVNTSAEDIAELVKQAYQDRLIGGGAGGAQRQPSPQEFIQMLRGGGGGGRRGGGGGRSGTQDAQQKMSIAVDSRNNALIVVAPDLLFQEIKQLVEDLDHAALESSQTMRVMTLKNANPAAVQQALSALVGENVQFGRTSSGSRGRRSSQTPQPSQPATPQPGQPSQPSIPQFNPFASQFQALQGFSRGGMGGTRGSRGGSRGGMGGMRGGGGGAPGG